MDILTISNTHQIFSILHSNLPYIYTLPLGFLFFQTTISNPTQISHLFHCRKTIGHTQYSPEY